jgi:hypothetical protein
VTFKITNRLKANNNNFKFNGDFTSHITVEKNNKKILEKHLVFPIYNGESLIYLYKSD